MGDLTGGKNIEGDRAARGILAVNGSSLFSVEWRSGLTVAR